MTKKTYLSANDYLLDSFRLARQILDSGWQPDELIALWRGGAPVGVAVHEFLYFHGMRPRHRALKCQSYTGIKTRQPEVRFENADDVFLSVVPGSRVLVIDDVFDTGQTARAVMNRLAPSGAEVRLATVYWKPRQNRTGHKPDFYLRETDDWIVFPHEMDGLTPEEILIKNPALFDLLSPSRRSG
ncbi:MAG: phosphoribosyltransferase family protein [Kiritimatiellae bacterium]|nr:phosphoribosyltransferase family protein [Kiritimatiellia bacterium]